MKITIDFETRSAVNLKNLGVYKYAEDETTEALCLAIGHGGKYYIWTPERFRDIPVNATRLSTDETIRLIEQADEIEAHNVMFERAIWRYHMNGRLAWPLIPLEKWRCSMAKAMAAGLPASLDQAATALRLPFSKDKEGYKVMLRLCKPITDHGKKLPTDEKCHGGGPWMFRAAPEELEALFKYCVQDVRVEEALSDRLRDLSPAELAVFRADLAINDRGFAVDGELATAARRYAGYVEVRNTALVRKLTDEKVLGARQVATLKSFLSDEGVSLPNLRASTVEEALKNPEKLSKKALELLQARAELAKASVAKYSKAQATALADGRIRGGFRYHGASTGRWSGSGFQPQNAPRGEYKDMDNLVWAIKGVQAGPGFQNYGELLEMLYDNPMGALSSAVRGLIVAAPGHELFVADYASIEARGLQWLALSEEGLRVFREKLDPYKVAAAQIFRVAYGDVTKEQRQIGKVAILALGYQGGWRAFMSMAEVYRVSPPEGIVVTDADKVDHKGTKLKPLEARWKAFATPIVEAWRDANPLVVQMWRDQENTAKEAARYPGRRFKAQRIEWYVEKDTLWAVLPSGRELAYPEPRLTLEPTPFGEKVMLSHMSYANKKWFREKTYGGRLVENITQAVCRDLLAGALVGCNRMGFPVVLHAHDEVVAEVPEGSSFEAFLDIVATVPKAYEGIPVEAEGWRGVRYRK